MKIRNALKKIGKFFGNNRGTWAATAVGISAAGLGLSGAQAFGAFGGGEGIDSSILLSYQKLPDYEESDAARKDWWSKLQVWGDQADYGAISPDWEGTWELAKKKINQYYWGGVGDTGLAGKVKASAARRNVSQSPALENQLAMLGMSEAGQISDLATQEAINKATFSESARQNWLTSLQNLAGLKPSYVTGSGVTGGSTSYSTGDALSDIVSGAGGLVSTLATNTQNENFLNTLMNNLNTSPSALTSTLGKVNIAPSDWYLNPMAQA